MVDLKVNLIIQLDYFWWRLNTVNVLWLFLNVGWSAVCDCAISWSYPLFTKLLLKFQTSFIKMNLIYFSYWPLQGGASFVNLFLHFVFCAGLPVSCSLAVTCWERADLLAVLYVMFSCVFVTFSHGVLDHVWYLIVSIPDISGLPYLKF